MEMACLVRKILMSNPMNSKIKTSVIMASNPTRSFKLVKQTLCASAVRDVANGVNKLMLPSVFKAAVINIKIASTVSTVTISDVLRYYFPNHLYLLIISFF